MENHDTQFEDAIQRETGIPAHWYSAGEREAMRLGYEHDRRIIDDPDGVTIADKLSLEPGERESTYWRDRISAERGAQDLALSA